MYNTILLYYHFIRFKCFNRYQYTIKYNNNANIIYTTDQYRSSYYFIHKLLSTVIENVTNNLTDVSEVENRLF